MEILEAVQQAGHKADPLTHTKRPIVTGTSVLGIQYKDGVMLAADTLGSYGSLARFKDLRRIRKVGARTLVGASGEYSDFQHILQISLTRPIVMIFAKMTVAFWGLITCFIILHVYCTSDETSRILSGILLWWRESKSQATLSWELWIASQLPSKINLLQQVMENTLQCHC